MIPLLSLYSKLNDSGIFVRLPITINIPKIVNITNMTLQTATLKMIPPSAGAITGATPLTSINKDRNLVNSLPLYKSLAMALEITAAPPPVIPCKSLKIIISHML